VRPGHWDGWEGIEWQLLAHPVAGKVSFDPKRFRIEWVGHFEDEQRAALLGHPDVAAVSFT
jgi:hypothetical protein